METYADIIRYFVKRKNKMGWHKPNNWFDYRYEVPECTMSAWYQEARTIWDLGGHYNVFRDCVENEITYDREGWLRERRAKWGSSLYVGGAFKRKKHHKKKELSEDEIRKKEWKKKVKNPRDQHIRRIGKGETKYYRKRGHRAERSDIKQVLKTKNWEQYFESSTNFETKDETSWEYNYPENDWDNFLEKDRKDFINSWDWW